MTTQRQALITARIVEQTGIDHTMIDRLVRAFYGKVRADALLAPVFNERIADWEPHLERMGEFWSSVAAAHFVERARRIAQSLEIGIAVQNGVLLMKGERLRRPDSATTLPGR